MCTVICRWEPGHLVPVRLLALRDELISREFDSPAAWWPDQPRVIGGRDRVAGGTWCGSDVETGVTAVVLNYPETAVATPGAASRGALPLLACRYGRSWPDHIDFGPMAGFHVVLAEGRSGVTTWSYDGKTLTSQSLLPGTYMFTPRGLARSPRPDAFAKAGIGIGPDLSGPTETMWSEWLELLEKSAPSADPLDLLVRIPRDDDVFQTVFGQFIAQRAGRLRLDYVRDPGHGQRWTTAYWDDPGTPNGDA
jgi:uncharacterized protein with NRDE domain